ncbi:MAG: DUF1232 domain-containing protein [Acidobacteria bacterium]|jgi:uncharacterized membrane protein YkvA (DUF1232 family)|nr:DUF1232 domain-containing protein [Acidobacteriota bacterium]
MELVPVTGDQRLDDFYKRLRARIDSWLESERGRRYRHARYLILVPDLFHLLIRLTLDGRVPGRERALLVAAVAYVVSPADFLPELVLGPVAFADDLVLMALVVNRVLKKVPREVVLEHWSGREDLLDAVQGILTAADRIVGGRLWGRIKGWVQAR